MFEFSYKMHANGCDFKDWVVIDAIGRDTVGHGYRVGIRCKDIGTGF